MNVSSCDDMNQKFLPPTVMRQDLQSRRRTSQGRILKRLIVIALVRSQTVQQTKFCRTVGGSAPEASVCISASGGHAPLFLIITCQLLADACYSAADTTAASVYLTHMRKKKKMKAQMHTHTHTRACAAGLQCDCVLSSRTLREWQEAHGARRQHMEAEVSWVLNDGSGLINVSPLFPSICR